MMFNWITPGIGWEVVAAGMMIATVGGIIRGLSGFGGGLVMTVPLALVLGPQRAVFTVLLLEAFAAMMMLREATGNAHYRLIAPICIASCLTIPLGGYLLLNVDPHLLRQGMAGVVIVFSAMLLKGTRYSGPRRIGTSVVMGAFSGILLGATSMGGPPVILYLLSGPDSARVNRANLTMCVGVMSIAGLVMMWLAGIVGRTSALEALMLAPFFFAGLLIGVRLFPRLNEEGFRQFALILLATVSAVSLILG
jgi:uncharacterized membrane protein YfcA